MISYGLANNQQDLQQILQLQEDNYPENISLEELNREGFVTVKHDLDLLEEMNQIHHHVLARDGEQVVGYALVMLKDFAHRIPVLVSMFKQIDQLHYRGQSLDSTPYFIMGQICIAKDYRGQGLFPGLYKEMKSRMMPYFPYVITEVSSRNPRSLRAHQKVGFETIRQYQDEDEDWHLLLWDWSEISTKV